MVATSWSGDDQPLPNHSRRHLPLDPLHRSTDAANDPRHLEDAVTGIKLLADGVLDFDANRGQEGSYGFLPPRLGGTQTKEDFSR
jgi:hypothetical protein